VSLRSLLVEATRALAGAGVPSPRYDAEELAAHVAGVSRGQLWRVDAVDEVAYRAAVGRRAAREPLQHITGRAYFRHLTLAVGPGVFVPRPETELVAGAAIEQARRLARPVVVDLCAGSGAIALAVSGELPEAVVHAVEVDPLAHAWAERNCAGSGVDLRLGDAAEAFPDLDGSVDVVVSNPPYIPAAAAPLDPEVRDHDPAVALWSGPDGLDAVRVVERAAARLLRPGGLVVVEHADAQGRSAPAVFTAAARWADVADHADLSGRPRFVTARLR
jgi:release factor glutamine methyltransferase